MKIALLLRQKRDDETERIGQAVLFDVEKDKVVGVQNETLGTKDVRSLSSWAITKKVKEIYLPEVDEQVRSFFRALGISMKRYDELDDNKLFQTFII